MIECYGCDEAIEKCTCACGPQTMSDCESIPCPWCGKLILDLFEYDRGSTRIECDHCEREVDLDVSRSVTYSARRALPDAAAAST